MTSSFGVDPERLKSRLIETARSLGAVAVGVAPAAPLLDAGRLERWLEAGHHADMDYLARTASMRADPRRVMAVTRSVICLAVRYGPVRSSPPDHPVTAPAAGRLAQLFAGRDYHRTLREILDAVGEQGKLLAGTSTAWRSAVDTAPLLERSLAFQAGLGAIGKNTQLIVPGVGSMVALGVLLTDCWLPPDSPLDLDPCGSCSVCLAACPTAALQAGAGLDSRRCLSWVTTATRAPIPDPLRATLSDRLYGCDACQAACPHNHQDEGANSALIHSDLLGDCRVPLDELHHWLSLGSRALRRALGDRALAWLPPAALRRTLCVVLGNLGDPGSVPILDSIARGAENSVAEHACWALSRLGRG